MKYPHILKCVYSETSCTQGKKVLSRLTMQTIYLNISVYISSALNGNQSQVNMHWFATENILIWVQRGLSVSSKHYCSLKAVSPDPIDSTCSLLPIEQNSGGSSSRSEGTTPLMYPCSTTSLPCLTPTGKWQCCCCCCCLEAIAVARPHQVIHSCFQSSLSGGCVERRGR